MHNSTVIQPLKPGKHNTYSMSHHDTAVSKTLDDIYSHITIIIHIIFISQPYFPVMVVMACICIACIECLNNILMAGWSLKLYIYVLTFYTRCCNIAF